MSARRSCSHSLAIHNWDSIHDSPPTRAQPCHRRSCSSFLSLTLKTGRARARLRPGERNFKSGRIEGRFNCGPGAGLNVHRNDRFPTSFNSATFRWRMSILREPASPKGPADAAQKPELLHRNSASIETSKSLILKHGNLPNTGEHQKMTVTFAVRCGRFGGLATLRFRPQKFRATLAVRVLCVNRARHVRIDSCHIG
jgi:hypothetical protein